MFNYDLKENLVGHVTFIYYRDHALWYRTQTGMMFPIPMDDLDTCQLLATEKAMVCMKWIRKYIASQKEDA